MGPIDGNPLEDEGKTAAHPGQATRRGDAVSAAPRGPRSAPRWLLEHRVRVPDLVAGYVERPELEQRCSPMRRQLTVLQAPGGFGKTALLAQCCHRLRETGVPVAWLELADEDGPVTLGKYLTLAFERAGVATSHDDPEPLDPAVQEPESDALAAYRINRLIRAVRRRRDPCILALDQLERLRNPEAVNAMNALLARSPGNLRFLLAFREWPPGLDIAMHVLEGRGAIFTAQDLRFSKTDIDRFFDRKLSRRALASVTARTAGWPIALRIHRNRLRAAVPADGSVSDSDAAAAWIDSRLLRGLGEEDREFLLDIALFDSIDAALIDEATGWRHSQRRIESMTSLAGLFHAAGGAGESAQLHPLIREHCAKRRFGEDPARFRSVHAGIARGLARRGQLVDALRHAAEAGDAELLGDIAANAVGINLWIDHGFDVLRRMDGWLTPDVVSSYPRLALMRCVVLALSGNIDGARRVYRAAAIKSAGFARDAGGGQERELTRDRLLVDGLLSVLACAPLLRYGPLVRSASEIEAQPDLDPLSRGMFRYGLCHALTEMGKFDRASEWAERARMDLGLRTQYVSPNLDYLLGLRAMAQGRCPEAAERYEAGLRTARVHRPGNTGAVLAGEILMAELELEQCAGRPPRQRPEASPRLLGECGAWLDVYAAGIGVAAEGALTAGGVEQALALVDEAGDFAGATERFGLVTYLSGLRISLLAMGGRAEDARRAWRGGGLPERDEACLNFKAYRWREVEALVCARLRLLITREDFDRARRLALQSCQAAAKRGLVRTLMRVRALSMRLEHLAGEREQAAAHLVEYVELFTDAGYVRPLAQERDIALPLLEHIAGVRHDKPVVEAAIGLRSALARPDEPTDTGSVPTLTNLELEVLKRLEHQTDNEIATALGLTYDRVRYRVRGLFAKLDVRGRLDAVHRARALGILASPPGRSAEQS